MLRFKLEWRVIDRNNIALVFHKDTFAMFRSIADKRGVETTDMIAAHLMKLLGPVIATKAQD